MTGPDESQAASRPISVAELLARNGTLGAPPVTGRRRRRRRGNADAVTVAELTGEMPVIRADEKPEIEEAVAEPVEHRHTPPELSEEPVARRGRDGAPERSHDPRPHRESDVDARLAEAAEVESAEVESAEGEAAEVESAEVESPEGEAAEVESAEGEAAEVESAEAEAAGAELMSPDLVDVDDLSSSGESGLPDELGLADASSSDAADSVLFGGDSLVDELSRGTAAEPTEVFEDLDTAEPTRDAASGEVYDPEFLAEYYGFDRPSRARRILRDLLTVVQLVFAVAFGAGLFLAFDQLWKWNSLVAMVLAILVTLGLVAGVWVVRKTEDIASTLIAVGVGLLVTFGPLALMQAG